MKNYLSQLQKTRLTPAQEYTLAVEAKQGNVTSRNKLIEANLPFAVAMAKKFVSPHVSFEQLVSAANEGMLIAAEKFNPDAGVKFITFASYDIRSALIQEINNSRIVFTPYKQEKVYTSPIDAPLGSDDAGESTTLADFIGDESASADAEFEKDDVKAYLHKALSTFDQRTKDVLDAYFHIYTPYATLEETSSRYDITPERCRNIKNNALAKLKLSLTF
jgi:RNA polymerase primary sigma factor